VPITQHVEQGSQRLAATVDVTDDVVRRACVHSLRIRFVNDHPRLRGVDLGAHVDQYVRPSVAVAPHAFSDCGSGRLLPNHRSPRTQPPFGGYAEPWGWAAVATFDSGGKPSMNSHRLASCRHCIRFDGAGAVGAVVDTTSGARRRSSDAAVAERACPGYLGRSESLDVETRSHADSMSQSRPMTGRPHLVDSALYRRH
jgi:hypothetical protein